MEISYFILVTLVYGKGLSFSLAYKKHKWSVPGVGMKNSKNNLGGMTWKGWSGTMLSEAVHATIMADEQ